VSREWRRRAEQPLELAVLPHAVAVASDVNDVAVLDQPVDQGAGHDVIAEDLAHSSKLLLLVSTVEGALVAASHGLEEQHARPD
jgi:hypothetical protein